MKRTMSVAGSFYPDAKEEIEDYFQYFNKVYDKHFTLGEQKSRMVIVPHAGYVYSGFTANAAYRILQSSDLKRFVVIGPSHRIPFTGVSLCDYEEYDTPFGPLKGDQKIVKELEENFSLECLAAAHREHSTEVQFPFIKYYIPDASVVELVYSDIRPDSISTIIDYLLKQEDIGIIISTDLSHFYPIEKANSLDHICIDAIKTLDVEKLYLGCEACGKIGVEAAVKSASQVGLKADIIDYRTSADVSNDTESVVGYVSAYFT